MSRKLYQIIINLFVLILAIYLAYDAVNFTDNMMVFLEFYVGNFQTYFFVFTLIMPLFILFNHVHYLQPEYITRIKPNFLKYIVRKIIMDSLKTSSIIYSSFLLGGVSLGLYIELSLGYLILFIQLFIFIIICFLVHHAVYMLTSKWILGLLILISTNMFFLTAVHGLGFILIIDDDGFHQMFYIASLIYLAFIMIKSLLMLIIAAKNKECYS